MGRAPLRSNRYAAPMQPGDRVDDFTALDQDGNEVRLSELLDGGPVVLFFYLKAKTPL